MWQSRGERGAEGGRGGTSLPWGPGIETLATAWLCILGPNPTGPEACTLAPITCLLAHGAGAQEAGGCPPPPASLSHPQHRDLSRHRALPGGREAALTGRGLLSVLQGTPLAAGASCLPILAGSPSSLPCIQWPVSQVGPEAAGHLTKVPCLPWPPAPRAVGMPGREGFRPLRQAPEESMSHTGVGTEQTVTVACNCGHLVYCRNTGASTIARTRKGKG